MDSAPTNFYSNKSGESIKIAKDKWVLNLIKLLSSQINSHKEPTPEYIWAIQNVTRNFTDNCIHIFFKEAPFKFKYLPKPSEVYSDLKDINKALKKDDPIRVDKAPPVERWPWPNSVIGLIMGLDDPRGLSPYGMKALDINKDQAKFLHDCWKKLDWNNQWALEIINSRRRTGSLSEILSTSL